jgi:uncharacterized protein YceK
VTDTCGNTTSASQTLTVQDSTAPSLVGVPADATVECDAVPEAGTAMATDNCDPTLTIDFSEVNSVVEGCGTIVRTWSVTDSCGNTTSASQTLTVQDSTAPSLVGVPADATVECDAIPAAAVVTATDNCDPTLTVVPSEVNNVVEGCGTIVRTWTVTDTCGNTTAASQMLTVQDSTAPSLVGVPADATVECDAIPAAAVVTATDNCDPTLTVTPSEVNNVVEGCGTITRTWTVTDTCGNSTSASQTLTVQDSTAPSLVGVPADATVECDRQLRPDCASTVQFNHERGLSRGCDNHANLDSARRMRKQQQRDAGGHRASAVVQSGCHIGLRVADAGRWDARLQMGYRSDGATRGIPRDGRDDTACGDGVGGNGERASIREHDVYCVHNH